MSLLFVDNFYLFFFSSRRRHTRWPRDWSSDVCSSDLKTRRKFTEKDFVIKSLAKSVKSMVIKLDTEIITKKDYEELQIRDGNVISSFDKDVWKVAAIDRTHGRSEERRVGKEYRYRLEE